MVRTFLCSLAGAGAGFFVAYVVVQMMTAGQPTSETAFVTLFFGCLLGGSGAVAGALIGGVADLLAYFKRRDEAARDAQSQSETESRL
jgi:hypothetical protein